VSFTSGLQSEHVSPPHLQVAATLKHFGIYGMDNWCPFIQPPNAATERSSSTADSVCYNRGHFISNVSLPDLHDYFLEPFRRGVVDGGARSMMISEDGVNGSPGPTSPLLSMTRQQWYACEPLHSIRPHLS